MIWRFAYDRPIYAQIIEHMQRGIVSGEYPPGSNMPSVRALALEAEVNPNTMQRALSELEAMGLLHTQRASGRSVTENAKLIAEFKEKLAEEYITGFFLGMGTLGIESKEAIVILNNAAKEVSGSSKKQVSASAVRKEVE